MPRPLFQFLCTCALLLTVGGPLAHAQLSVNACVDKTTMGDGETLLYTVEATGDFANLGPVEAPSTRGLVAVQTRPVQNWSVAIRNGVRRQQLKLQWQFRPIGTGKAYLGDATIYLDGRAHTTAPITVDVVPQAQRPSMPTWTPSPSGSARPDLSDDAPPADLFLRAEPARADVWVGEQVVVDYVLYFEPDVLPRNSRIASAWDADGFWREELELDRYLGTSVVQRGGRTFEAAPIKRLAVFPTRAGTLRVDSLDVEVDVLRATRLGPPGSPRSFLYNRFGSQFERETITATPVVVEARPLPTGAPSSFAGAVGEFGLAVEVDRGEVEAGEPVRITATVSGQGNIATLEAPTWDAPDVFEQYPVRAAEQIDRSAARVRGRKTFTYTLVPQYGGRFTLPPVTWTYFEPEAGTYRTLRSDSLRVRVLGPAAPLAEATPATIDPDALVGPRSSPSWQRPPSRIPFYVRPWAWAALALPALAFLGLLAARRFRREDDSAYARSLRAFPAAEQALKEAAAHLEAGETRAFFAALERTVHLFLTDRLGASTRGLALPDLDALLADRGVTAETRGDLAALLRTCDAAQFAPHPPAVPPDPVRHSARLLAAVDAEAEPLPAETADAELHQA